MHPLSGGFATAEQEHGSSMKIRSVALRLACWSAFCWLGMTQACPIVHAADEEKEPAALLADEQPDDAASTPGDLDKAHLRFTFEGTPWRDVIEWLAKQAELSVYVGSQPPGSLTYSDEQKYTPDQAIAKINSFLLPNGYTLIRSGKMLSVIGLEDSRRDQLLDSLAEYADLADLDRRGDNEVVKCIFTIAKTDPQAALEEISGLVKLSKPLLMPRSKQLVVIETAARLRIVRDTLEALENPDADAGPVRRFELEHVSADEVLAAVRPLVGIEDENTNVGEEINLSAAADGKQILATGSSDKLAVIEGVVQMLDKPPEERDGSNAPVLRAHPVEGGSLQAVDDVLQTLLEDEDVRLAQERKTSRLIVLATEDIHKRVEETIDTLEAEAAVFEVIQLERVEAYVAISLIREMLDIPYFADEEDEEQNHPRLDWDPPTRRIFVRGTRAQVDEVKKIVDRLEQPRESTKNSTLRLLPIQGARAQQLLETGKRFWPGDDDVLIFPPSTETPGDLIEREINGEEPKPTPPAPPDVSPTERDDRAQQSNRITFATMQNVDRQESEDAGAPKPPIKAQVTPRGILLQSNDVQLLNEFEKHLRTIAGPNVFSETMMAIFYLKHVGADEAKSLLSDIRRGESSYRRDSSLDETETDELEGPRRPRRSYYSYFGPSVIADARLNRLIVQGSAVEILRIEKHLKIIDRDKSIADVQIRGKSHVVKLVHIRASEAAAIVRDAYGHELSGGSSAGQQPTAKQQQQLQQEQLKQLQFQVQQQQQPERALPDRSSQNQPQTNQQDPGREGRERNQQTSQQSANVPSSQGQQTRTKTPTMTMAVNEKSNSLIIRAPEQLFREVSELIRLVDKNATQATEVISIRGMNPEHIKRVLRDTIGSPRANHSNSDSNSTSNTTKQPAAVQTIIRPSRT